MNRISILFSILLLILLQLTSYATGIVFFNGTWEELLAEAKKQEKVIFVDSYTIWCGPCKWMSKEIFPSEKVGQYYNANFICYKLDMEKGEGVDIAKKYGITAYPTFLFLDSEGRLIHRFAGGLKQEDFVELGKTALDPERSLASLKNKYDSGNRDNAFMLLYIKGCKEAYIPFQPLVEEYFTNQKDEDLYSEQNWFAINEYVLNTTSPAFIYLANHHGEFEKKHGKDAVEKKIFEVIQNSVYQAGNRKDEEAFISVKKAIEGFDLDEKKLLLASCDLTYYDLTKNTEKYCSAAGEFMDNYILEDAERINEIAWNVLEYCNDTTVLSKTETFVLKGILIEDSYNLHYSYAVILHRLGKDSEAITVANEAIEIAKKNGDPFESTTVLINAINREK